MSTKPTAEQILIANLAVQMLPKIELPAGWTCSSCLRDGHVPLGKQAILSQLFPNRSTPIHQPEFVDDAVFDLIRPGFELPECSIIFVEFIGSEPIQSFAG